MLLYVVLTFCLLVPFELRDLVVLNLLGNGVGVHRGHFIEGLVDFHVGRQESRSCVDKIPG